MTKGFAVGYTHYYSRVDISKDDALRFEMFSAGARRIIEYAVENEGIQIADGMGDLLGKWVCDNQTVRFNGYDADSHETFEWSINSSGFDFTKTARKPYDAVVTACLIHLKDIYGELVSIGSDGSWSEWQDGARLYRNATGLTASSPFEMETA
jgi:hypothetical protein